MIWNNKKEKRGRIRKLKKKKKTNIKKKNNGEKESEKFMILKFLLITETLIS